MRDGEAHDEGSGRVTALLSACSDGDASAFDRLVPLVYDDLRRIAHKQLRGGFGESRPVADNLSAEGKQKNRRVELVRLED